MHRLCARLRDGQRLVNRSSAHKLVPALGLLLLAAVALRAQEPSSHTKQLIEFGWDEPDTAFLRAHIQEMQATPFAGCVFHVDYARTNGSKGSFTWEGWGRQAFSAADLSRARADLRATRFGRFRANFLRFNTTPAKLDWFDDYSAVLANAKLAAQLARAGHCAGILLDTEEYEAPLFSYRKQGEAATKTWAQYATQARVRGRQVMQAFQAGFPSLTVFLTFGYSLPWDESQQGKRALAECKYGLMAPFLDGMIEAAHRGTRIVDGHEGAYGYKERAQFLAARASMRQGLLPIVADPAKYHRVCELGFGLWLDNDWRKRPWDTTDLNQNYFSPQAFQASLTEALRVCDQYVWIYSETPRWWSANGRSSKLPAAYEQALRQALSQYREPGDTVR